MQKAREPLFPDQLHQDDLMAEAEADMNAGRAYRKEETHEIVNAWMLSKSL